MSRTIDPIIPPVGLYHKLKMFTSKHKSQEHLLENANRNKSHLEKKSIKEKEHKLSTINKNNMTVIAVKTFLMALVCNVSEIDHLFGKRGLLKKCF